MQPRRLAAQRGLTLVETIFGVAIMLVLGAASLPALGKLIGGNRAHAAQTTLLASLDLARASAITRMSEVVLCPSDDRRHCTATPWWQHGWIVFQDVDGDGKRDADEPLLAVTEPLEGIAVATSAGRERVVYRYDGSAGGTNLTFTLCDRRGPKYAS